VAGAGVLDELADGGLDGAGMPVQAIWAAAAMSFWWLVRHTG
jgi:hypothetical protein